MISPLRSIGLLTLLLGVSLSVAAQTRQTLEVEELQQPVEILKDQWGISHIYAETEHDLFLRKATVQLVIVCFSLRFGGREPLGPWQKFSDPRR